MSSRFGRFSRTSGAPVSFVSLGSLASAALVLASAACLLNVAGCSERDDNNVSGAVTGNEDNIVGGVDASGAQLNAIGSLGKVGFDGKFSYFCTATLVAPSVVLSAKHCLQNGPDGIFFAIGPDSTKPIKTVAAREVKTAPDGTGGFVQLGQDVALVVLAEPIEDVTPLQYINGHIPAEKVGSKLTAVGFGIRDRDRTSGQRRAGALTLQGVDGQPLHKLFATLEDLLAIFIQSDGADYVESQTERMTKFYDLTLKDSSEAYLGLGKDDAQPCSGDSGGPLIGRLNGKNVVFAVVSGSFKTRAYPCSVVGEVYATFPPQVQDMLAEAIGNNGQAIDPLTGAADPERGPCGYTTVRGHCEGVLAVRCVSADEGPQKVTKTDCGLLGQLCGIDESGNAGCVDDATQTEGTAGAGGSSGEAGSGGSSGEAGTGGSSGEAGTGGSSGEGGAAGEGG
jgi:uncharacterized membrane protein YgcG